MNQSLLEQIDRRILDMQLETVQCLLAAARHAALKAGVRDRIERAAREFHGMAAFAAGDPVEAFASLVQLDVTVPDFRTLAEPFMQRIRSTRYLIPSAVAQEFLTALPAECWDE